MSELGLSPWHVWCIIGVVLLIAEVFISGFIFAGLGLAAFPAAVVQAFTGSLGWALIVYSMGLLVFLVTIRPIALKTFMKEQPAQFGPASWVGSTVRIVDAQDDGGALKAWFRDSPWTAVALDGHVLLEGDMAEIVEVKEGVLVLKPVADI